MRTSQISLWVDEIHRRRLAELTRLTGCSNSELVRRLILAAQVTPPQLAATLEGLPQAEADHADN